MNLPESIFRAYDIRGVVPSLLNEKNIFVIGQAMGTYLIVDKGIERPCVVVGRDSRESSDSLSKAFMKGLVSTGVDVVDNDLSLTPIIHFLTCTQDFDAGVMLTASHNPPEFNGLRLDFRNAVSFSSEDIANLYRIAEEQNFVKGTGSLLAKDLDYLYIEHTKKEFSFSKRFKVVLDCGFGTVSEFIHGLFDELGIDTVFIDCSIDMSFPRGVPDPENTDFVKYLEDKVLQHSADVGIAFDEDADRFGIIDELGQVVPNDMVLLLLSEGVLKKNPGGTIVYDIKSTSLLSEYIKKWGGVPHMTATGHNNIQEKVLDGAVLGGEFSGHAYFNDVAGREYVYDDGIYGALRFIKMMNDEGLKVSQMVAKFPTRISSSEIKLVCDDTKKFELIKNLQETVLAKQDNFKEVLTIDGVRVNVTDTGWFLVRASNTSPYLSVRLEAKDIEEFELLKNGVSSLLSKYDFVELDNLDFYEI